MPASPPVPSREHRSREPRLREPRIEARLRGAGLRPTRQRVSLGHILFGPGDDKGDEHGGDRHVSAECLHEEAARRGIHVSLATVYNTLHQFTQAGLLRAVAVDSSRQWFDTNVSDHHHFFIEDENAVVDVPASHITVSDLPEPPEGMEIERVDVIVRLRRKR